MARNPKTVHPIVSNGQDNCGSSFNSDPFALGHYGGLGVQVVVANASALNGLLEIQVSNDQVNWSTAITGGSYTLTADGSDHTNVAPQGHLYMRFAYTRTAGDCQLDVSVNLQPI